MKTRILALAALMATLVAGCGGASDSNQEDASASSGGGGTSISLVAYSTPQVVYDEIISKFSKTPEGEAVSFKSSYGGSGDQSPAVEAGQPADFVAFSLAGDMERL